MSMWTLAGFTPAYASGANGTVTLPPNAVVLQILCHSSAAGGTCSIFGGSSIPIINGAATTVLDFKHLLFAASGTGTGAQIVFANTDSYFVHYLKAGNV